MPDARQLERKTVETWQCWWGLGGQCGQSYYTLEGCIPTRRDALMSGKERGICSSESVCIWGGWSKRRGKGEECGETCTALTGVPEVLALDLMYFGSRVCVCAQSLSCVRLCNPMNHCPPDFSVHGILQARILEWVAISSSRGSSWPRDRIHISYVSCLSRQVFFCFFVFFLFLPLGPPGKPILLYTNWFYLYIFIIYYSNPSLWSGPLRLKLTGSMKTYNTF